MIEEIAMVVALAGGADWLPPSKPFCHLLFIIEEFERRDAPAIDRIARTAIPGLHYAFASDVERFIKVS